MKKNVCGIILAVLGAAIAAGAATVLGPCVHEDGSAAACTAAGTAVLCGGCVLAALAAAILCVRSPAARTVLFFVALCACAVGTALPGTIFPLCKMDTMRCRAVMQPAAIILFAAALIVSACGIITERKRAGRNRA